MDKTKEPIVKIEFDESAIRNAIRQVNEQDWVNFFEFLRQQQYKKIGSANDDVERLSIQLSVKGLHSIQNTFSELMKKPLDK